MTPSGKTTICTAWMELALTSRLPTQDKVLLVSLLNTLQQHCASTERLHLYCSICSVCECITGFQATPQHGTQGQNVEALLALTFMEAALGAERIFQAMVRLQCSSCAGSGLSATLQPVDCAACYGTGQSIRCQSTSLGKLGLTGPD